MCQFLKFVSFGGGIVDKLNLFVIFQIELNFHHLGIGVYLFVVFSYKA